MRAGLLMALTGLFACGRDTPRPIAYGAEPCTHCHMTIADPRFVAEAVLSTGKGLAFDDIGCLAAWLGGSEKRIRSLWVSAFTDQQWLRAEQAVYLRTDSLRTPMASGLIAARPGREADSLRTALGGTLLSWAEVAATASAHEAHDTP